MFYLKNRDLLKADPHNMFVEVYQRFVDKLFILIRLEKFISFQMFYDDHILKKSTCKLAEGKESGVALKTWSAALHPVCCLVLRSSSEPVRRVQRGRWRVLF